MKAYDADGLVFFTNPDSHKGEDLRANPKVALCFFWDALNRQIRIEGRASFISEEEANVFFSKLPRVEKVRAWVSEQSKALNNLEQLKHEIMRLTQEFGDLRIPRRPLGPGIKSARMSSSLCSGNRTVLTAA